MKKTLIILSIFLAGCGMSRQEFSRKLSQSLMNMNQSMNQRYKGQNISQFQNQYGNPYNQYQANGLQYYNFYMDGAFTTCSVTTQFNIINTVSCI